MGSTVFNKYPSTHTFEGRKVLNLGCGFAQYKAKNVTNLDGEECSKADVVWDLSKMPMPFEDETFDLIIANHILEHVPNWWACFEDCARILKTGGRLEIWVPGAGSDSILGFRDHINTINHCSFWGTYELSRSPNNAWAAANAKGPSARMKMLNQYSVLEPLWWIKYSPKSLQNWYARFLRNVVFELGFVFEKMPSPKTVTYLNPAIVESMI